MNVTFLGGGALRLLGVVDEILKRPAIFSELRLTFMDLDLPRAKTIAALTTKMPSAARNQPTTTATDCLESALEGADFVFCCIRVGGVTALERDKRIGASHGFHGHDDFGPSAVMLTARTVPVVLQIARRMEAICPRAWLLVFTNPITTLVDAVTRHTAVRNVGLCPGVFNFAWDMDALFEIGVPNPHLWYRGGGLNHVSWITPDATYKRQPVMDMIWTQWDELPHRKNASRCDWTRTAPLVKADGVMPLNNGHQAHFFYHDLLVRETAAHYATTAATHLRSAQQTQAAEQAARLAQQPSIENFWSQPAFQGCAAGPFGDIGARFMQALVENNGTELIVTTPNCGRLKDLLDHAPVETPVRVWRDRLEPIGIDPVPAHHKGLCNAIAHHQRLVVDAAIQGDKQSLFQALLSEPTIRSLDRAAPMFEELWAAHHSP